MFIFDDAWCKHGEKGGGGVGGEAISLTNSVYCHFSLILEVTFFFWPKSIQKPPLPPPSTRNKHSSLFKSGGT